MENFMENWRDYIYGIWLGGALSVIFGVGLFDIRWWLVVVPTIIFVRIFNENQERY